MYDPYKYTKTREDESNENDNFSIDEDEDKKKKAESLFSKNFFDYLINKSYCNANELKTPFDDYKTLLNNREYKTESSDEITDYASDQSSKKSMKKQHKRKYKKKKSNPFFKFNHPCRNKFAQCNLPIDSEEVTITEELKPFLSNISVLLNELEINNCRESVEFKCLHNMLAKIIAFVTEIMKRPLSEHDPEKKTEFHKSLEKNLETILNVITDYRKNSVTDLDVGIREFKRIEREILQNEYHISEATKKWEERFKVLPECSNIDIRLANSILANEKLKAIIKFNQSQIKKYKKRFVIIIIIIIISIWWQISSSLYTNCYLLVNQTFKCKREKKKEAIFKK